MTLTEIQSLVGSLKAAGMDSAVIKNTLANMLDASGTKWEDTVDVPNFGQDGTTVVGTTPAKIIDIFNGLLPSEDSTDPSEDWEKAKEEAAPKIKSKEAEDKLHKERIESLPENQKRLEEEQSRINDNSPITVGMANSILPTLFADVKSAKDKGYIKQIRNLYNILAGKEKNKTYADKVISDLYDAKNSGKYKKFDDYFFSDKNKLLDMIKRFGQEAVRGDLSNLMENIWNKQEFGKTKRHMSTVTNKERTTANRVANEMENMADALKDPEHGQDKATAASVQPKYLARRENLNDFDKLTAHGTNEDAALKSILMDAPNVLESNVKNSDSLKALLKRAQQADYTVDFWLDMFDNTPGLHFYNSANPRTIDKSLLLLTAFDDEHPEGVPYPLFKGEDVYNFIKAVHQSQNVPEIKTVYTNLNTKANDATDETNLSKKYVDRFNEMWQRGNPRYVFQDPKFDKIIDRDENGFVTEYDRDKKPAKAPRPHDDNYFKRLANIWKKLTPETAAEFYGENEPTDGTDLSMLYKSLRDSLGDKSANKARSLYRDIRDLGDLTEGTFFDKDTVDPSILRSLSHVIGKLRGDNTAAKLSDIPFDRDRFKDATGIEVHPKFGGNLVDLLGAALKINNYKRNALNNKPFDVAELRGDLDANIKAVQDAINAKDFSKLGKDIDANAANEILGDLNLAREFMDTDQERKDRISKEINAPDTKHKLSDLKSLAEEAPEEYERALADYQDAELELEAAKKANADFDVINMLRNKAQELRSKEEYLKNTKVDIQKRAEETGKPYQEVLKDYLNTDWEEDDDTFINRLSANYDLMDRLKEAAGGQNPNKENVKFNTVAEILDKLAGVSPTLANWRDRLTAYEGRPMAVSTLLKSQKSAGDMLGLTPKQWAAWINNKEAFDTDTSDKRRNTIYTDKPKSASGIAGVDTVDRQKFAKQLQDLDYTNPAGKADLYNKVSAENEALGDKKYTKHEEAQQRLENASDELDSILKGLQNLKV